jgi:hypothetical protein
MDDSYCRTAVWEPQRTYCMARDACASAADLAPPDAAAALCAAAGLCPPAGGGAAAGAADPACAACVRRAGRAAAAWAEADVCAAPALAPARAAAGGAGAGAQGCHDLVAALQATADDCRDVAGGWDLFAEELHSPTPAGGAAFAGFCSQISTGGARMRARAGRGRRAATGARPAGGRFGRAVRRA